MSETQPAVGSFEMVEGSKIYSQFQRMFHVLKKRMFIVQLLDEIFCKNMLSPFDPQYSLSLMLLCGFLSG